MKKVFLIVLATVSICFVVAMIRISHVSTPSELALIKSDFHDFERGLGTSKAPGVWERNHYGPTACGLVVYEKALESIQRRYRDYLIPVWAKQDPEFEKELQDELNEVEERISIAGPCVL